MALCTASVLALRVRSTLNIFETFEKSFDVPYDKYFQIAPLLLLN